MDNKIEAIKAKIKDLEQRQYKWEEKEDYQWARIHGFRKEGMQMALSIIEGGEKSDSIMSGVIESSTPDDSTCKACGSNMVNIRGRAPMQMRRDVCPTCAVEKLESYEEQQVLENLLPSKGDSL